jgi:GMP synthase-like glutamine amidotransferase
MNNNDYESIKKEEYNEYKHAHLFFFTYIKGELHLLLHKDKKSGEESYEEIHAEMIPEDNTAPFAISRILSTKYRGLFRASNLNKLKNNQNLIEVDLTKSNEYFWWTIWENEMFHEALDLFSSNPIQYDLIKGRMIYFVELPEFDVDNLNKVLAQLNYEFSFIYKKYSFTDSITNNENSLLSLFDFDSFIKDTQKAFEDDTVDYFIIISCKPPGARKDQAGFFHFPALFHGIFRKNREKWLYYVCSTDELPDEKILKKVKAVLIPGSHLNIYNDFDFLRKTEEWVAELIKNWPSIKFLGLCFGMQLLSTSLGGKCEPIGGGVFIRSPEKLIFEEDFWNLNYVKLSGVERTDDGLVISQAHGDHVTLLPDFEAYRIKTYAFSDTCKTELIASDDGRILCFQGHPEYTAHFSLARIAPIMCQRYGYEPNVENYHKFRDDMLKDSKYLHVHCEEYRKICHSFLKN